jgi:hypothetical protein
MKTMATVAIMMMFMANSLGGQTVTLDSEKDMIKISDLYFGGTSRKAGTEFKDIMVGPIVGNVNNKSTLFFCYDFRHSTPVPFPASYSAIILSPSSSLLQPGGKFADYQLSSTWNIELASTLLSQVNIGSSARSQFAGLQLAVWDILYNWSSQSGHQPVNSLGTSSKSGFYVSSKAPGMTSAIYDAALGYLQMANNDVKEHNAAQFSNVEMIVNNHAMTQVLAGVPLVPVVPAGIPAPEPGTYLILGSLLAITGILIKKKTIIC